MPLDKDKVESLISTGSDIAGAATGGAIGFLTGGPGGAALGGSLGVLISKGLSDITNRVLSTREKIRVGATAAFALEGIKSRLDSGDKLRNDGFFETKAGKRADAEEIFEGVLLKAKNEHEEKKTRILGNIFANTAFSPGFSTGEANHLLRIAENLTYRKMSILSLISRKRELGLKLRDESYSNVKEANNASYETISSLQEIFEMYSLGLIVCVDKSDETGETFWSMTEWNDIAPSGLKLTALGKRYYKVMGLDDIAEEDIQEGARPLS